MSILLEEIEPWEPYLADTLFGGKYHCRDEKGNIYECTKDGKIIRRL